MQVIGGFFGQKDDRNVVGQLFELENVFASCIAIHFRHLDIQNRQIGQVALGQSNGFFTVTRQANVEACG